MSFEVVARAIRCIDREKLTEELADELADIIAQLSAYAHLVTPLELRALEIAISARRSGSDTTCKSQYIH